MYDESCSTPSPEVTIRGSSENESVIRVSELTRRFGATTALSSVNFSVTRGVVHGLVGANGAGKTTLIKHILGLLRGGGAVIRSTPHRRIHGLDGLLR